MSATVRCQRCLREAPAIPAPPYPGELGQRVQEKICIDCWREWQQAEVMVINELRLNFMDPRSQEILVEHMKEFLMLDQPEGDREPLSEPESEPESEPGPEGG